MLQHHPVMAATYQAMTRTAAAAAAGAGPRHGTAAQAAARARRARARVACAASPRRWISGLVVRGTSWDPAVATTPRRTRRRQPDQRFSPPPPARVPQTFLPDEGESEPAQAQGSTPQVTLGSSPPRRPEPLTARLNAVGASPPPIIRDRPSPPALRRTRRPG
jgi:hypothetical protein